MLPELPDPVYHLVTHALSLFSEIGLGQQMSLSAYQDPEHLSTYVVHDPEYFFASLPLTQEGALVHFPERFPRVRVVSRSPIGVRIKELREARGWSLNKLALKAGCSQGYLSDVENGKISSPSGQMLVKLAAALGASTDYLLGITDNPIPQPPTKNLSPDEQLDQLGVWLRGSGASEEDITLITTYLAEKRRLRKTQQ
jgi:transcriptional regulator with XRE-family HTH domain